MNKKIIKMDKEGFEKYKNQIVKLEEELANVRMYKGKTAIFQGDNWHDNPELYQTEAQERSLMQQIRDMKDNIRNIEIVEKNENSDTIDVGDIVLIETIFDEDDIEIKEDILPTAMSQYSQFAEEPVIKGQKQIDDLFKFLSEVELNKQSQKMLSPLISLLESCEDYEEAYELLTDKNLHTKQLEQSIQKAMFLCELQGRSDGLDE